MTISESDWRKFKEVREVALDRFCKGVLKECRTVSDNASLTAHERYGELFTLIHKRNEEMALAFDDFRRSTALLCLMCMVSYRLLTDDELSEFSPEAQHAIQINENGQA